jgi:phage shock protein E
MGVSKSKKIIIDVREPREFERGHVDGAINIPPKEIMARSPKLDEIDKDSEIVLYCISGSRSNICARLLAGYGFTNVVNGINQFHVETKHK